MKFDLNLVAEINSCLTRNAWSSLQNCLTRTTKNINFIFVYFREICSMLDYQQFSLSLKPKSFQKLSHFLTIKLRVLVSNLNSDNFVTGEIFETFNSQNKKDYKHYLTR